ncbi:hypothetical protein MP228_005367 [Amoeboaphelidium protococcarum]|nr:hypothetical protein MP228_005367 [Amoeboaphelidium protococcarum]
MSTLSQIDIDNRAGKGVRATLNDDQKKIFNQVWKQLLECYSTTNDKSPTSESGQSDNEPANVVLTDHHVSTTEQPPLSKSTPVQPSSAAEQVKLSDSSPTLYTQQEVEEFFKTTLHDDPDVQLLKFICARKWNVEAIHKMLKAALKFRVENDISNVLSRGEKALNQRILQKGLAYSRGFDKNGHPLFHIQARYFDKKNVSHDENNAFCIFMMECAKDYLLPWSAKTQSNHKEKVSLILDLSNITMENYDLESIKFLVHALEAYYPESLACIFIINAPFFFNGIWMIVKQFLDPVVREKIKFVKTADLLQFIDSKWIPKRLGGDDEFQYEWIPFQDQDVAQDMPKFSFGQFKTQVEEYIDATKNYIQSSNNDDGDEESDKTAVRLKARQEMNEQWQNFEKTRPRTYYHRIGMFDTQ